MHHRGKFLRNANGDGPYPIDETPEQQVTPNDEAPEQQDSSDDDDSAEDSNYRPPAVVSDSEADDEYQDDEVRNVRGKRKVVVRVAKGRKGRRKGQPSRKRAPPVDNDPESSSHEDTELDGEGHGEGHRSNYAKGMGDDSIQRGPLPNDEDSDGNDNYVSEQLRSPISTDDESSLIGKQVFPQFNEGAKFGHVTFETGMEFINLESFKNAVRDFTIYLGREIYWVKNDKVRALAKCKVNECPWKILCSWSEATGSFQIKTFFSDHTCCRGFKNKAANRKWVVKQLEEKIRCQPTLTHIEAFEYLKREFGVHCDESKIFRSLKKARELVEGCEREQYGKIWDYAHELLRSNPGSTVKINTIPQPDDSPPIFQRIYICLHGCKRGFKDGCRPLIGLDGCFLKGYFGGQLLSAVGQDANNQIFVIAYAVVDVENKDNWLWFLTLLHEDLGDYKQYGWNFISDMQKGLIPAMQEVMPGVPHRFCVMHLWRNFTKQWKNKELKGLVWECAKSTTENQFNNNLERVKRLNQKAWEYLAKWPKESWSKAFFSESPKVDNICNNNCEVFNAKIVRYRAKPILTMLEEIRCYIMRTMSANKLKLASRIGPLTPFQQSRLEKEKIESNQWTPHWSGDAEGNRFEVQSSRTKVDVNLTMKTCTCRFWQLTGMPCMHACAAIAFKHLKPEDYCHAWLTIGSYNATYAFFIQPTQGEQYWRRTEYIHPVPPKLKRRPGRPKKQRRKDGNEEMVSNNKLKRSYVNWTCKRCNLSGHKTTGCKNYGCRLPPKNWVPPPPKETQQGERQVEIDLSQSHPSSQPLQSEEGPNHTTETTRSKTLQRVNVIIETTTPQTPQAVQRGIRPPPIRGPRPTNAFRSPQTMGSTSGVTQVQHAPVPSPGFRPSPIRPTTSDPRFDSAPIGWVPLPPAPSSKGMGPQEFIQFMPTPRLPPRGPEDNEGQGHHA